jgi:hypothetical protein
VAEFMFKRGDRVKDNPTGEFGTVLSCDVEPKTNLLFYRVKFDDGITRPIVESELSRVA